MQVNTTESLGVKWGLDMLTPQLRKSPNSQLISKHCWWMSENLLPASRSNSNELMMQICSLCSGPQMCLNLDGVCQASALFSKHTGLIRCWSEQMFVKVSSRRYIRSVVLSVRPARLRPSRGLEYIHWCYCIILLHYVPQGNIALFTPLISERFRFYNIK